MGKKVKISVRNDNVAIATVTTTSTFLTRFKLKHCILCSVILMNLLLSHLCFDMVKNNGRTFWLNLILD